MSSVEIRRRVILDAIAKGRIETQEQMVAALSKNGVDASQASVSRDITALRLVKIDGRWTAPPLEAPSPTPGSPRSLDVPLGRSSGFSLL